MKYELKNLTPKEMACVAYVACPAIYEITPKELRCTGLIACPGIYEITPKEMQCGATLICPSIFENSEGDYLLIGQRVNPEDFGLEKKVGPNEVLIKVPKKLIDDRGK